MPRLGKLYKVPTKTKILDGVKMVGAVVLILGAFFLSAWAMAAATFFMFDYTHKEASHHARPK